MNPPPAGVELPQPSQEQQAVIDAVARGDNVIVEAVAGAGKTTTVLCLARACPDKHVLEVTYNAALKVEVRDKAHMFSLDHLAVHTYHSMAVNFYDRGAHDDKRLRAVVESDMAPTTLPLVDVMVIDEMQDMRPLYFMFIHKMLRDLAAAQPQRRVTVMLLGDREQRVYGFLQADARFLTLAGRLFDRPFVRLHLRQSYRVPASVAWFVNAAIFGEERIVPTPGRPDFPVTILRHRDKSQSLTVLRDELLRLFRNGYKHDDVFILAPSLRSTHSFAPFRRLENFLVDNKVQCYVPLGDDSILNDTVLKDKVVFSTFHQAKGRERKIVVVLGFDRSYYEYFARESPPHVCIEPIYVAITRASERLFLLASHGEPHAFLRLSEAHMAEQRRYVRFIGSPKVAVAAAPADAQNAPETETEHRISVTALVRHIREDIERELSPILDALFIQRVDAGTIVPMPVLVPNKNGGFEDVCDINSMAITSMYSGTKLRECTMTSDCLCDCSLDALVDDNVKSRVLHSAVNSLDTVDHTIPGYLRKANIASACNEQLAFKVAQLDNYDWLTPEAVAACHAHLDVYLTGDFDEEVALVPTQAALRAIDDPARRRRQQKRRQAYMHVCTYGDVFISGRIDVLTADCVWEFKCTQQLKPEHMMQLTVYAWLWDKCMMDTTLIEQRHVQHFRLLNIRSGEMLELRTDDEGRILIQKVLDLLLKNKYGSARDAEDDAFVAQCLAAIATRKIPTADITGMMNGMSIADAADDSAAVAMSATDAMDAFGGDL